MPAAYDTSINRGIGVPDVFYHFAFAAESHEARLAKRAELIAKGVAVSPVVDHEGWVESIYLKDPNGLLLEYAWLSRALGPDDPLEAVRERHRGRGRGQGPGEPGALSEGHLF